MMIKKFIFLVTVAYLINNAATKPTKQDEKVEKLSFNYNTVDILQSIKSGYEPYNDPNYKPGAKSTTTYNNMPNNYNKPPTNYNNMPNNYNKPPTNYNNMQNNYNKPPTNYNNMPNNYNNMPTNYNKPPTNYNKPPTNYNKPPTNYNKPPTNYNKPPTNYNKPPTNYNKPPTNYNKPPTNYNKPPTNYNKPPTNYNYAPNNYNIPPRKNNYSKDDKYYSDLSSPRYFSNKRNYGYEFKKPHAKYISNSEYTNPNPYNYKLSKYSSDKYRPMPDYMRTTTRPTPYNPNPNNYDLNKYKMKVQVPKKPHYSIPNYPGYTGGFDLNKYSVDKAYHNTPRYDYYTTTTTTTAAPNVVPDYLKKYLVNPIQYNTAMQNLPGYDIYNSHRNREIYN